MKTTMKKVLSMALALVLVVGMLPMAAQASHTHEDLNTNGTCDHCNFNMTTCGVGNHTWDKNSCTEDKVCTGADCGATKAATMHTSTTMKTNDGYHWYDCDVCGEMYGAGAHSGGTATCSTKAKCEDCNTAYGAVGTAHTGGTATCKTKAICADCGQEYGAVDPTKHVNTEVRYAKAATCGADGHTGDVYCLDCGNIAYGSAIPATGAHTWSAASCTAAKTCSVCGATEGPAPTHSFPTACGVDQICSVCRTPNPTPINHTWVDANCTTPKTCSVCRKTEGGALGHSWDQTTKTCRICNVAYDTVTRYTVYYNVNVGSAGNVAMPNKYEANTPMSTVLADLALINPQNPSYFARWYSLEGWYLDPNYTTRASGNVTREGITLYAKWVRNYEYNVYLKIYTNGNSSNLVRIEDMFEYAQDHVITLAEVNNAVNKYIKSNNNAPLTCYGPFFPEDWDIYLRNNHKLNIQEKVTVYNDRDTTLYVMVHNAQIGGSSSNNKGSKADSTNPKTGDMILMPAAVLGLSASSLAVLYYLDKKKRVM